MCVVVMKAVDVSFKKIDVLDYYSQLDQVKVRVLINDGQDKQLIKQITIADPSKHAMEFFNEIKSKIKEAHTERTLDDHPLAGALIIRVQQEEDVVLEKMAKFFGMVRERIRSGKLSKLSYFDLEKKIVGTKSEF